MRLPFGVRRFDAVFNLFTSFGYFDDPADDLVVVENIARALKPDGLLVLDYLNARVAERNLRPIEVVVRHGALFQITRWTGATHLFKRIECHEGATSRVFVEQVAKLTLEDFQFLFHLCGLKLEAIYGDYQLNLFDPDLSPRLILIARKAGENSPVDLTAGAASAHATQGLWRNAQI
jgi:SAM-dependent methyltransferase